MIVATVAPVATIAEQCVSIYRYRRWNTFFDDSGDSSDGSDYMEIFPYNRSRRYSREQNYSATVATGAVLRLPYNRYDRD